MIQESDLLRLIEGDCSPEEAATIQKWVGASPERQQLLEELRALWRHTGHTSRPWNVAAARARLRLARGPRATALRTPRRSWWTFTRWRMAAAIAVVVGGGMVWAVRVPRTPFREYATGPAQWSQLTFPDGSRALLSVGTRLRVPRDFGVRARAVDLEGEAYFVVLHDSRRPFLVHTRHGTTQDLGTAFDVRAYPREHLQVVVATGSVAVRNATRPDSIVLTLRARERGVIDARGRATRTSHVRVNDYLAWTRGALLFDDAPLRSVLAQLERWYDLDVQTDDPSLDRTRVTIAFTNTSSDEALRALAAVLNLRVTRAGRVVRLAAVRSPE